MKDEEKASSISPEKKVDSLLEEITERETLAQSTMDGAKGKVYSDHKTAKDMQILALESIDESRKGMPMEIWKERESNIEAGEKRSNFFMISQKKK